MCDYCDCRSHPEIARLSAEHDVLQGLLVELRRAIDASDRSSVAAPLAALHEVLDGHATREERGVFTELRGAGVDAGYVGGFERDHHQIHALLDAAAGDDWAVAARELVHVLGDHIAREERDLFPAAHQLLAPHQWTAIDAASALTTGGTR